MFSQEMPEDFDAPRFLADLREADSVDDDDLLPDRPNLCMVCKIDDALAGSMMCEECRAERAICQCAFCLALRAALLEARKAS